MFSFFTTGSLIVGGLFWIPVIIISIIALWHDGDEERPD
jgi:hypothetical protein